MQITVNVTQAELRGMPFPEYSRVLHNLIGESQAFGEINIGLSDTAVAVIEDDDIGEAVATAIPEMAQEMTRPDLIDGYFN